jgi:hypothetical protein
MKTQRTIALTIALALVALAAAACGGSNSTPTKAYQTFYNAMKNKDVKALKSVMPKELLDQGEQKAKAQNKSLDDAIKEGFDRGDMPKMPDKMPESKDETIASDGKTATLQVKNPESDKWDTLHFIKEDDGWKIDFKKMMMG